MKVKLNQKELNKGLQKVTDIISSRSTLLILSHILFKAEDDTVTLTTTDLEVRISVEISAEVIESGVTTLPAKKLQRLVNNFQGDEVIISKENEGRSTIECDTYSGELVNLSVEDFPEPVDFAPVSTVKFKESEFGKIIDRISYAVSLDDARKVLHGLLFSIRDNTFTAVATDGKRLALIEKILENIDGEKGDSIIPLKSANTLKRLMDGNGDVEIKIGEKQIAFITETTLLSSKLIQGTYPNYRKVIPLEFSKTIQIKREPFLEKLNLVSISLQDSSSDYIKLSFSKNKLTFDGSSQMSNGTDHMEIDYSNDEVLEPSLNPKYIEDPFRHCDADSMILKINDAFTPIAIEDGEGFLYVIMPLRMEK